MSLKLPSAPPAPEKTKPKTVPFVGDSSQFCREFAGLKAKLESLRSESKEPTLKDIQVRLTKPGNTLDRLGEMLDVQCSIEMEEWIERRGGVGQADMRTAKGLGAVEVLRMHINSAVANDDLRAAWEAVNSQYFAEVTVKALGRLPDETVPMEKVGADGRVSRVQIDPVDAYRHTLSWASQQIEKLAAERGVDLTGPANGIQLPADGLEVVDGLRRAMAQRNDVLAYISDYVEHAAEKILDPINGWNSFLSKLEDHARRGDMEQFVRTFETGEGLSGYMRMLSEFGDKLNHSKTNSDLFNEVVTDAYNQALAIAGSAEV